MKTAISIPDEIFEEAERMAKKLGVSRSELYATAVHDFVDRHRRADITERLDAVYADRENLPDKAGWHSAARQTARSRGWNASRARAVTSRERAFTLKLPTYDSLSQRPRHGNTILPERKAANISLQDRQKSD
ncbi:MAG: hypothetical protein LBV36_03870 [Chromatiales bacterium]|jgi:predicted transcriptional regulator|nr:hypothetical protein [Chromatiales bacterium]